MVTRHMYFAESTDTYGIAFLELPNYNIKKYELLYPCFFVTEHKKRLVLHFQMQHKPKKHNQFLCWSTGPKTYTFLYHFLVLLYCKKSIVNYFCKNSVIILENLSYIFLFCYNRKNHFDFINIF